MAGSALAGRLLANPAHYRVERYMQAVFALAAAALFVPVLFHTSNVAEALADDASPGAHSRTAQLKAAHFRIARTHVPARLQAPCHAGLTVHEGHRALAAPGHLRCMIKVPTNYQCRPAPQAQLMSPVRAGISWEGKLQLVAFCVFEAAVGLFWPSMMKMRSQHVPEETRSTIINFFRIPLNLFVCVVLYNVRPWQQPSITLVCAHTVSNESPHPLQSSAECHVRRRCVACTCSSARLYTA